MTREELACRIADAVAPILVEYHAQLVDERDQLRLRLGEARSEADELAGLLAAPTLLAGQAGTEDLP